MAQNKRELIDAVFHNQKADRVPVGFWHHFLGSPHTDNAFLHPELTDEVLKDHIAFYEAFHPDFLKIMTDGFFPYPNPSILKVLDGPEDVKNLKPLGRDSQWYEAQISFAAKLVERYGREVEVFYNLFTPYRAIQFAQETYNHPFDFVDWIRRDKEAVKEILAVLAEDYAVLARGVIEEAGADGIYFSVNNVDRSRLTRDEYEEVLAPGEIEVLQAANAAKDNNILHICGNKGFRNYLDWYKDYPVLVINWAAHVEEIPLEEGKKLFGGRAVIGGFGQTKEDVLYSGTKEEIEAETDRLLREAGTTGIILGADCTIPPDTDLDHLEWVRQAAAAFGK